MKLQILISRASLEKLRFLLHPSRVASLYFIFFATLLIFSASSRSSSLLWSAFAVLFFLAGMVTAWSGLKARRETPPYGLLWCLALGCALVLIPKWWSMPSAIVPGSILAGIVAYITVSYGTTDALIVLALVANLQLLVHQSLYGGTNYFEAELGLQVILLAILALVMGRLTIGQRRKIMALREELLLARSNASAYSAGGESGEAPLAAREISEGRAEMESLESGIDTILCRIKEYFQAQSVLLYQPYGHDSFKLRHSISNTNALHLGHVLAAQTTPLGAIALRGISCNWNLDDPNSEIKGRDIPYYSEWQQIRSVAGCPLKIDDRIIGVLVLDRNIPRPFSSMEIKHLETFAIQLVELIQMGKRYLEQLDRNMEYRIFYQAMSRLGRSLATHEVVEALGKVCQEVAPSTHILIALLDEARLSYEIAYAHGAPQLLGSKVDSHGRTWLSWALNSKSGPILLRDIRSHVFNMPIASPREEPFPVRSVLLIPLSAEGVLLGAVLLGSGKPDVYRNWHLRILTAICGQASAGVDNALLHRKVETEALSDGLTHLHNHRYFQERLKSECSRVKRNGGSISLLMIDIDHFKKINDTYGHRVGDVVLQQVAAILKGRVRSEDIVARYGGEEFVMVLSSSGRKGALRMAERSRLAVKKAVILMEEHKIGTSVSIGTATFPDDASEPMELIEHADRALYAAKGQGRNRVVQFHDIDHQISHMTGVS